MYCGSLSTICLAKAQVHHDKTKHIDARYHFRCTNTRVKVKKIEIVDNPTHFLTKCVPFNKFKHCFDLLNIDNNVVQAFRATFGKL